MPVEVLEMLNGTIPATAPMRCACGNLMPANDYGRPCDGCMQDIWREELWEATKDAPDYAMLQDGGID